MTISWFIKNQQFFLAEQEIITNEYPSLKYREYDGMMTLTGKLPINASFNGERIRDCFKVALIFPDDYPKNAPIVKEVGKRKKRCAKKHKIEIVDLHYYQSGTACLCMKGVERLYLPNNQTTGYFIKSLVVPFFYWQSYFETHGRPPWEGYNHSFRGVKEFYREKLNITKSDDRLIIPTIKLLAKKGNLNGNWECPCGSNRRWKSCHSLLFKKAQEIRRIINQEDAKFHLERFK